MKLYENISRYFLATWQAICAVDGWLYLLFDIELAPHGGFIYLSNLVDATYFWTFLKIMQTLGAISLFANYKPALGLAILTPITAVLCLFYIFEFVYFIPIAVLLIISTYLLFRAYAKSFLPLLESYS